MARDDQAGARGAKGAEAGLAERELEALSLMAQGWGNGSITEGLIISLDGGPKVPRPRKVQAHLLAQTVRTMLRTSAVLMLVALIGVALLQFRQITSPTATNRSRPSQVEATASPEPHTPPVQKPAITHLTAHVLGRVDWEELPCNIYISPTDERFFCLNHPEGGLRLWRFTGRPEARALQLVVQHPSIHGKVFAASWSPGGDRIVYSPWVGLGPAKEPICLFDASTGQISQVAVGDAPAVYQVLPQGYLAYIEQGRLQLLNMVTGEKEPITEIPADVSGYPHQQTWFRMSPDRRYTAIVTSSYGSASMRLVDTTTGQTTVLAEGVEVADRPLVWSPDGRHVAFRGSSEDTALPGLWLYSVDGGNRTLLWRSEIEAGLLEYLLWSSSHKAIFFSLSPRGTDPSHWAVYHVVDPADGTVKPLFRNGFAFQLVNQDRMLSFYRDLREEGEKPGLYLTTLEYE